MFTYCVYVYFLLGRLRTPTGMALNVTRGGHTFPGKQQYKYINKKTNNMDTSVPGVLGYTVAYNVLQLQGTLYKQKKRTTLHT